MSARKPSFNSPTLPAPSLRDGPSKFNSDFERSMGALNQIRSGVTQYNDFAKKRIDAILSDIPKTEPSEEWLMEMNEKALEAKEKYWEIVQTKNALDLEKVLFQAELLVARAQATAEIRAAALACCDSVEEYEQPRWVAKPNGVTTGAPSMDCSWSYDASRIVVASGDRVIVMDPNNYKVINSRTFDGVVSSVHYSPSGSRIYVGTRDGNFKVLRAEDLALVTPPFKLSGPYKGMTIDPMGTEAVVINTEPDAALTQIRLTNYEVWGTGPDVVEGWTSEVGLAAAYSHNQRWLAISGSKEERMVVFSRSDMAKIPGIPQPQGYIEQIAFSRDDKYLMVCQRAPLGETLSQPTLMVIETSTLNVVTLPSVPNAPCLGVTSSANGEYISAAFMSTEEPVAVYVVGTWERESVTRLPSEHVPGGPAPASSAKFGPAESLILASYMGTAGGAEILFRRPDEVEPPELISVTHADGGLDVVWSPENEETPPDGFHIYVRTLPYSTTCAAHLPDPIRVDRETVTDAGWEELTTHIPDLSSEENYYVVVSAYVLEDDQETIRQEAFSRMLQSQTGEEFDDSRVQWMVISKEDYDNLSVKDPYTIYFIEGEEGDE